MTSKETIVDKSIFDTHSCNSNEATPPVLVNAHYRQRRRSKRKSKGKTNIRRTLEQAKHSKKPRTDISTHQARMIQFDLDRDNFRRDERNIESNRNTQMQWRIFQTIQANRSRPREILTRVEARQKKQIKEQQDFIRAIHNLNEPLPSEMLPGQSETL